MSMIKATFTGVDSESNLNELRAISEKFPFVEWGVLFSEERAGLENRYPSIDTISKFSEMATQFELNCAIHLCGSVALKYLKGIDIFEAIPVNIFRSFDRVQLNINSTRAVPNSFEFGANLLANNPSLNSGLNPKPIIQFNPSNIEFLRGLSLNSGFNFSVLIDASGGNGKSPDSWHTIPEVRNLIGSNSVEVGFAGGLGLDNILTEIVKINQAAGESNFWIDMEGKIRTKDVFDLSLVEAVCDILVKTF